MADQLTINAALARHSHLLNGTWQSAGEFNQRVCYDLRDSYSLIRKTGGTRCSGPGTDVDCDKVIDKNTHEVFDTVVSAGSSSNKPGWSSVGVHHDLTLVEPVPYDSNPPPPPPNPCQYKQHDIDVLKANAIETNTQLRNINAVLSSLALNNQEKYEELKLMVDDLTNFIALLKAQLIEPGMEIDASARIIGHIGGTAKLIVPESNKIFYTGE